MNGFSLKENFEHQGWLNFLDILNGPCYPLRVKDFWVRAQVLDKVSTVAEIKEVELKFTVMSVEVTIIHNHTAQLIGVKNEGNFVLNSKDRSKEADSINSILFNNNNSNDFGKVKNMYIKVKKPRRFTRKMFVM